MAAQDVARHLNSAIKKGATGVYFSGGEPTLVRELYSYVRAARDLGYESIILRTNGMMLSYDVYLERLKQAGLTQVVFSLKAHTRDQHDALSSKPGAFDLVMKAIDHVIARDMELEADLLVHQLNYHDILNTARSFYEHGVRRMNFQLVSSYYAPGGEMAGLPVADHEAGPFIGRAAAWLFAQPGGRARVYYTAPCLLGGHPEYYFDLRQLDMEIVDPGGQAFPVESTPMNGRVKVAACSECARSAECSGLREDYVEIYGAEHAQALTRT